MLYVLTMRSNSRDRILDAGLEILRSTGVVSLDSTAQKVGLSKAGVIHHFATKEALMNALVDRVQDRWEAQIKKNLGQGVELETAGRQERMLAYLDCSLSTSRDASDLVMFASPELRAQLVERWSNRLGHWLDGARQPASSSRSDSKESDGFLTVRLIADGAWFSSSSGLSPLNAQERRRIRDVCVRLLSGR